MDIETKARILDSAEQLFAEYGFSATSVRQITNAADVNIAAVNYHFGSKEELLHAVFKRRVDPINAERVKTLLALQAETKDGEPTLEQVMRAFLEPSFRASPLLGPEGAKFLQLVGRMHSETNEQLRESFFKLFDEVTQHFGPAFKRALPHLSTEEIIWRVHFAIGSLAHILVCSKMSNSGMANVKIEQSDALLEALVQFCTAGMAAALPTQTKVQPM